MSFAILPFALIDIAVGVSHSALALKDAILGKPLVSGSILELDNAKALPSFAIVTPVALILPILINLLEVIVPIQEFASII